MKVIKVGLFSEMLLMLGYFMCMKVYSLKEFSSLRSKFTVENFFDMVNRKLYEEESLIGIRLAFSFWLT